MGEASSGAAEQDIQKFGTFQGVFVPTLLTILGVIMYLRLGWVVGNVGLIGAWMVILISFLITTATALSMSSMVSNVRIGAGGAYSIITRSLGLEIGGSLGVPLYLALSLSMAMYIFGFREGIGYLFPNISPLIVDSITFLVVFVIVFLSTDAAFKVQYLILVIIAASLISVFAVGITGTPPLTLHTSPGDLSFWTVFAVFFPAATGIMAGANISGELRDPRRSIPAGTLTAIGVSLIIYMVLAYWLAGSATPEELVGTFTILIEKAAVEELVLGGLLAATFSSALNSLVGASRVLQAMGEHNILPGSVWFSQRSTGGTPRNAIIFTGIITAGALMLRDLNTIAPLITMFFLITYTMINIVILIEQKLNLISFRPVIRIPPSIPLIGAFGCLFAMFIIHPVFSLVAIVVVVAFYNLLMYRHLKVVLPYGDVRSSLFVSVAEWAAKKSKSLPPIQERAWGPRLLVPIDDPADIKGVSEFIRDIASPRGQVSILGIDVKGAGKGLEFGLPSLSNDFRKENLYANWTVVKATSYAEGTVASMQALSKTFFSPNIVFLRMPQDQDREEEITYVIRESTESSTGVLLYGAHPRAALGWRRIINVWISERCQDWIPGEQSLNCDLALLIAYQIRANWNAQLNIIATVPEADRVASVRENLHTMLNEARMHPANLLVVNEQFYEYLGNAPPADLSIFTLSPEPDFSTLRELIRTSRSTCLFCRDSSEENVLA